MVRRRFGILKLANSLSQKTVLTLESVLMKKYFLTLLIGVLATPVFATVTVIKPSNGATVTSPVNFVATATSNCSKGVASMGIYTAPFQLAYVVNGASLNTSLTMAPGTYKTVVQEWDYCGGATWATITITVTGTSGVYVTAPANNSTVSSPVNYVATATTTCSKGVAAMGIYTSPYNKAYVVNGASLNTSLTLSPGTYNTVVQEWDYCGGSTATLVTITVGGNTFSNLQNSVGWSGYGELPPKYDICTDCSPEVTWAMTQDITSPSLSGSSAKFDIGGTTPYADALWNNHLIGHLSSQGMPDDDKKIVPALHHFTYDVYFYGTHLELSEALEFDVAQFVDDKGYMWGTECRMVNGQVWDVWDNINAKWISTGIPCQPLNNYWNHLILKVQRTTDNQLYYESITLNGVTNSINQYYSPWSTPGWYGVVVNFQLDGNYKQTPYTVYLDNLNFTYY